MYSKLLSIKGTWRDVADAARTTIHKAQGEGEPGSLWKRRMLLCEHSPIRQLIVSAKWCELKYWVSVHFVRHKIGIEHWVRTQRKDRTGVDRDELPQDSEVEHEILVNAQAIINISRRRLCNQASRETREAWKNMLSSIENKLPELASACVPDCIYRGWCYEFNSCGYHKTPEFKQKLEIYRAGINS